ncbi:hypothetical protein DASC09_006740 [Saccharomycopsis crataegensis]|uniref:COX assembly mitochondrial protein n=1 Tax=Saccharomycopsis crataegensis TaxID=43959 RepID=A0AAV5QFA0_9ASCO|nr:hypothetical protein DASC09_006740 [Saccharomycopsis crataegensis]
MAPPVPVISRSEADKIFNNLKTRDCKLKEIAQFECAFAKDGGVICQPFTRLFNDCEVEHRDRRTKEKYYRRQMFEITTPEDNNPFRKLEKPEIVEFMQSVQILQSLMREMQYLKGDH